MSVSPTALSLQRLRSEGWQADVVERWIPTRGPGGGFRSDLFGGIDLLAVHDVNGIKLVQATTTAHVLDRVKKLCDSSTKGYPGRVILVKWIDALSNMIGYDHGPNPGCALEVWGWQLCNAGAGGSKQWSLTVRTLRAHDGRIKVCEE